MPGPWVIRGADGYWDATSKQWVDVQSATLFDSPRGVEIESSVGRPRVVTVWAARREDLRKNERTTIQYVPAPGFRWSDGTPVEPGNTYWERAALETEEYDPLLGIGLRPTDQVLAMDGGALLCGRRSLEGFPI